MLSETDLRVRRYPAQTCMPSHRHEEPSLSIVLRGAFVERIGRRERHYARGHVAFLPSGVAHSQSFGVLGARQIIFRPQPAWLDYLADCNVQLAGSPYCSSPPFRVLGERLLGEIDRDDDFAVLASEGLMLEIIAEFGRRFSAAKAPPRPPPWLAAARDYLHQRAPAPYTLRELARAAGRHEVHLAREFRRYFGASVGEYARRLRAEQAARLLRLPHVSISDIALDCGFSSHSHLCREFRAQFGVTPSQYRRCAV